MPYRTLYFDLDDTLYASHTGLWDAIRDRMNDYMIDRLQLPGETVPVLRRQYYETYGTTLRGLQLHHGVDAGDFLAFVHDLPLSQYLQPDPALRSLLLSLPQRRWIFTNADQAHACRVLAALGIDDCFQGVVDVWAVGFHCKPHAEAYRRAMQASGETDPGACVFFDDSTRNLEPARKLGFTTVLVGSEQAHPAAVLSISNLLDLPQAMPELWENNR